MIFICILDDYGYVIDADLKVFDDVASNPAWEIQSDIALEVYEKHSHRVFEGCGDPGTTATPSRLFPGLPLIDRDFNKTIWGSPGFPCSVIPPEKMKRRLPKPTTPKRKAAEYQTPSVPPAVLATVPDNQTPSAAPTILATVPDKRDDSQTPSAAPTVLDTVPRKTMIPMSAAATPQIRAVKEVGLARSKNHRLSREQNFQ